MSHDAATQLNTRAKKRAGNFMTVLGVAADITAVAALIFNKDLAVFVQIAAVAGIAVGLYLLLRQWGRPVGFRVLLAIVCITAGCVAGALSLQARGLPTVGGNTPSPGASSPTSSPTPANTTNTAFQFRLTPYTGIDLDAGVHAQSDVTDADGPNGNIDLFMSKFGYIEVNGGSFYTDTEGPDSEIHSRCTKSLTAQREPHSQILPTKATRACFKTSSGKMGWVLSNDADFDGQPYAVLNVRVW